MKLVPIPGFQLVGSREDKCQDKKQGTSLSLSHSTPLSYFFSAVFMLLNQTSGRG